MSQFKAKSTNFDFGWGSAQTPLGGAYPRHLAGFKGTISKGKGGGRRGEGGEGRGRKEVRGGEAEKGRHNLAGPLA